MLELDTSAQRASSAVSRYGLAVSSTAAALIVTLLLRGDVLISPLFFLAIMLSAWYGGIGPGLVAAALATSAIAYFFLPFDPAVTPKLLVFFLVAFLVSSWSATRRRAQDLLQQARDELEIKVQERTADLRQSNERLQAEIAERKRAEEAMREQASLLDLTHDSIFVRDPNDVITYWNRGAEELYGWKRAEAIGKVSHQLLQTIFPESLEEITATLLRSGRWDGELVHTKRDGTQVSVASRWSIQRDERRKPVATLETNNDITPRKQSEESLRKAQAELARVTRAMTLGELTASIAHEVNQPIAGVVTNANACLRWLARDVPELDEAREAVQRIVRDGNRASQVIGRIRALVGKTDTAKERLDVNGAIREVVALAEGEVRRARVALRTELADELPPVLGDRVQLQQVVLNLITNGSEAMSAIADRPRELIIRTERGDDDDVRIAVQDSGVGLDSESAKRIFDSFYTTKIGGMGMGLSISRSIVENHGGRLWAVPNHGPGATFQFTLPKHP